MIHVDGQSMLVMDSVTDRMRLKDKIVANVAKAIKSIQELQVVTGTSTITLGNYDWQCHRLCEHLDHAMLHGLRHVTPGYWKIVSEFTHKDCIKDIKRMRHVTTDLGRGRAWLFMALNESLLESYIRCYQQNQKLVNQYYVNDALVRDQQDVPYLDLCVYPPDSRRYRAGTLEAAVEFDKLSLCSMDSIAPSRPLAQAVVVQTPEIHNQKSDSDTTSTGSVDVNSSNHRNSPSIDSGCHSDWNFRQRSITPIENVGNVSETKNLSRLDSTDSITEIADFESGEVLVQNIKTKRAKHGTVMHKHKKKKKKKPHNLEGLNESDDAERLSKFNKDRHSVEIPPIDEIKFEDAIMNCQNNNVESSSSDYSLSSEVRSPGDGHEVEEKAYSPSTIKTTDDKNSSILHKDKSQSAQDKKKLEQKSRSESIKTEQNLKKVQKDSGSSQEMLRARVSSIVEKGDPHENKDCDNVDSPDKTVDNEEDNRSFDIHRSVPLVKNTPDVQYRISQSEPDMSGLYKAGLDATVDEIERADPHLYSGSPIPDEETSDIKEEKNMEKMESIYGGPSIYSNGHDSDSCNSDLDDNLEKPDIVNLNKNNTCTLNKDMDKVPVFSADKFSSIYGSQDDSKSENQVIDIYAVNHELESSGSDFSVDTKPTTLVSHNTPSPRHTPSPTNQRIHSKSLTSYSHSGSPSPSAGSRQSPYPKDSLRASPSQRTDTESQRSDESKSVCSTPSSEVELQGSELELKGRVDELINNGGSENYYQLKFMEEEVDNDDFSYDDDTPLCSELELKGRVDELINKGGSESYHHLTFVEEEVDDDDDGIDIRDAVEERERSRTLCEGEVELDNNGMLFLMLDVLETNETFIKMFSCRQGHTEGKTSVVFVLISTDSLYILSQQKGDKRFSREATVAFLDIDFVSLGFNNQFIHIVCKNRKRQYWFTTGEERVTIAIIDCLASCMEKSESKPAKLEVDTDGTTQKISLRKYVSKECRCETSEADILCYSLVHWEDPSISSGSCQSDREGNLLYKSNETVNMLGTQTWRPAYAVLKDCMLCLYHDKNDPKPQHFLSMGGEQCVGCKRDFNSDRNHSIRVMLADGTFWSIALATEFDANDWIQALCQAVSEGLKMSPAKTSNIPCCMILTRQKLLMCHEDTETSFVRTLGSANLVDITAVLNDELCSTFVVLAFDSLEANVSSEKWVLYFNSEYECERFIKALSECWSTYFQVEVPVIPMEDFALQKKCREMADYLKKQLALK